MTKKNKLLSLICLAVLSIVCAFGMMFSGSVSTAKAEELTVPVVDATAVFGRDVSSSAACSGGSSGIRTIKASAKGVDYIIIEWINGEGGIPGAGGQTFFYGLGGSHTKTVAEPALSGMRGANAKVQVYYNTATGAVTVLVNGTTEYALTELTPVADPANTESAFTWCFHAHAEDRTVELKQVKAYTNTGSYLGTILGDRWTLSAEVVPTTAVSSTATGKNYTATGGGKYISSAKATSNDWIIFEVSTIAGENEMQAGNNFHFGLGASAGSGNATDVSVSDWSPITPIQQTGTTRYWINRITGSIYVSTNALTEAPVLRALTQGGNKRYTYKNAGLESVYGKIYFNANVTKIDLNNVRVYDETGADLGISTNLTEEIDFPNPDVASIEGVNLVSKGAECTYFASNTATKSEWIIFDWTNANETTAVANGSNSSYCGIGTTAGNNHKTPLSAQLFYIFERENYTTVKLAYNTRDGKVYKATNGGAYALAGTVSGVAFDGNTAVYASFCIHKGGNAIKMNNLKVYDAEGTNLGVKTSMSQVLPTPDVSGVRAIDLSIRKDQGSLASAKAPGSGARYVFFDWTNGPSGSNKVNNPSNSFHMAITNNGSAGSGAQPQNVGGSISTYDARVRVVADIKTGDVYYEVNGVATKFNTLSVPSLTGEQYYTVGMLFNGFTTSGSPAPKMYLNGLKVYDDLGNDLGAKFGGTFIAEIPTPNVSSIEGVAGKAITGCSYISNKIATRSEWIIFEWTNIPDTALASGGNNSYAYIGTGAGLQHGKSLSAGLHFVFNKTNATNAKIAFNTIDGKVYRILDGGDAVLAGSLGVSFDGTTDLHACFDFHTSTSADVTGLKIYDGEGNDLGVDTNFFDDPEVDSSAITETSNAIFNKGCGGNGYFYMDNAIANATGAGDGAKWIIFEWTNGANNAVSGGNGAFIGVQTDPDKNSHAKNGVGGLFAANGVMKLYVNVETGVAIYTTNGAFSSIGTLALPELQEGQYAIVNFGPHTFSGSVILTDIKCYDDLGNNLGVNVGGNGATIATEPAITSEFAGTDATSTASANLSNEVATTSEWIVFEWTNGASNTIGTSHNAFYLNIVTEKGAELSTSHMAAEHLARIFGAQGKKVKLYFNTREGYLGYAVEDLTADGEIHVVAKGLGTTDGSTAVYAKFSTVTALTGVLEDLKVYDADGENLAFATNMAYEIRVNFTNTSTNPRPGSKDYLIYWDVTRTDINQLVYPSFSFGGAYNSLVQDGQVVTPTNVSSAYTYTERHMWQFSIKTLDADCTDIYEVKPTKLYFAAGTELPSGNITYIVENDFYIFFSGTSVVVSDTDRQEISLLVGEEDSTRLIYSDQKRYQGNVYANIGGAPTEISLCNIVGKKNGTNEEVVLWWEHGNSTSYMYLTELDAEYTSHLDVIAQWYLLPAGSVIGNIYTLDADYVMQINCDTINLFRRDKVFTVTFDNLQGATAPAETTFSYATDFEVTLPSISNPEGFVFNGWKNGNDEITTITPGMFGSDVTVTANLSDGEKAVDVQTSVALGIQSDISMIFYVKVTVYDLAELSANFSFTYAEGRTLTQNNVEFVLYQAINDNVGIYAVTFDGILPQHMGDEVIFKVMEGETELGSYSASVVDYCSGILAIEVPAELQTDAAGLAYLKTLVCDLLEYGTAMQEYTAHDTANTPSALVGSYGDSAPTEFTQAEGVDDYRKIGEASTSYYWKSAALVYDYVPTLVVKFVAPESAELSVVINVAGSDDSYVETEFKNCGSAGDGLVVYELSLAFPPMMFDVVLEFAICDAEVQYGQTLEYSANAYIANVLATGSASSEETAILKAIYNYGVSAKAYNEYDAIA